MNNAKRVDRVVKGRCGVSGLCVNKVHPKIHKQSLTRDSTTAFERCTLIIDHSCCRVSFYTLFPGRFSDASMQKLMIVVDKIRA